LLRGALARERPARGNSLERRAAIETGVVADLTHEGEGVIRGGEMSGKTVFVAGALPGERVSFRRRSFHKSHDEAELIEVHDASPKRVAPRCAHFGVCGGCAHAAPGPRRADRGQTKELAENLERIGKVEPVEWLPPLLGPHWNYRRRARLSSRFVTKKGRSLVGFREKQGKYVADVQRCEVLAEPVGSLVSLLADLLTGMARRTSIPQIEVALSDGERVLVFRVLDPLPESDLDALRAFERTHGLRILLQPGGLDTIAPLTDGPVDLHYRLDDFDVSSTSAPPISCRSMPPSTSPWSRGRSNYWRSRLLTACWTCTAGSAISRCPGAPGRRGGWRGR
jgi:23S rRNA (uracil1939-C5)-methyltransferase